MNRLRIFIRSWAVLMVALAIPVFIGCDYYDDEGGKEVSRPSGREVTPPERTGQPPEGTGESAMPPEEEALPEEETTRREGGRGTEGLPGREGEEAVPANHIWVFYPDAKVYVCDAHEHAWQFQRGEWVEVKDLEQLVLDELAKKIEIEEKGPEPYLEFELHMLKAQEGRP